MGLAKCSRCGINFWFLHLGRNELELGWVVAWEANAWRASWEMKCGTWTLMGLLLVLDAIGITTLLSSSSSKRDSVMGISYASMCSVSGMERCGGSDGEVGGAVVNIVGGAGFRHGDRHVGWGIPVRPGVLLRVTRLCIQGAFLIVRGAVGLLDHVSSTLGGCAVGNSPSEIANC